MTEGFRGLKFLSVFTIKLNFLVKEAERLDSMNMNNLKVNLHITESCNFKCKYCFAYFNRRADLPLESWKKLLMT